MVGDAVPDSIQKQAHKLLEFYGMKDYSLQLIQGSASANIQLLENKLVKNKETHDKYEKLLMQENARQAAIHDSLQQYRRLEELSSSMKGEIKVLYPAVKSISLAQALSISTDTLPKKRYVAAIVELKRGARMKYAEQRKMSQWIEKRVAADSLRLFVAQ